MLVLSCQIQDELFLYYKNMDLDLPRMISDIQFLMLQCFYYVFRVNLQTFSVKLRILID